MPKGIYLRTTEARKNMSLAQLGKHLTMETKQKIREFHLGTHLSEVTKKKMSLASLGKPKSEEHKRNIRLSQKNEKGNNWKGDNAKYRALHSWIRKNKPKSMFCEECKKTNLRLNCANITRKYTRNPHDYKWLCYSCHNKIDIPLRDRDNNTGRFICKGIIIKL